MAEGILKSLDERLEVFSAGTRPEKEVNKNAVKVMKELGIDISGNQPKNVDLFTEDAFDYVITVCDDARENCPYFAGKVGTRLHMAFEDPALARGSEPEVLTVFRSIRDQICAALREFYKRL